MELDNNMSDEAILSELGGALARRRIEMGLTQAELAKQAGVGKRTIERVEAGSSSQTTVLIRILRVLDSLGDLSLISSPQESSPLDLLKRRGKTRKRVSTKRVRKEPNKDESWTWGDEE